MNKDEQFDILTNPVTGQVIIGIKRHIIKYMSTEEARDLANRLIDAARRIEEDGRA